MASRKGPDDLIVAGVVSGQSRSEVARAAGISPRTLRRRLSDPAIVRDIADARLAMHEQLAARLAQLAMSAVDELQSIVTSGETDHARIAASRVVLDQLGSQSRSLETARWNYLEAEQAERLATRGGHGHGQV